MYIQLSNARVFKIVQDRIHIRPVPKHRFYQKINGIDKLAQRKAARIKCYLTDKSHRKHQSYLFYSNIQTSRSAFRYAYEGNNLAVFSIESTSQTGRSLLTKGRAEGAAPAESSEYAWLCNLRGP